MFIREQCSTVSPRQTLIPRAGVYLSASYSLIGGQTVHLICALKSKGFRCSCSRCMKSSSCRKQQQELHQLQRIGQARPPFLAGKKRLPKSNAF